MGLSRVTLTLFLFEFSSVFSSGGRRKASLPFSSLLKNERKQKRQNHLPAVSLGEWWNIRIFFAKILLLQKEKKAFASKKEHWWNLTAVNFNIWLEPRKGGETCHVNPCELLAAASATLPAVGANSPPEPHLASARGGDISTSHCGSSEGAVLPQPLVYVVIWVISFSSFPGALIKRGGSLVRAVPWVPEERWACLELLDGRFHGVNIFK